MPKSPSYRARRRWTADDARAALSALERSGLSIAAFAASEGLDVQRLRHWRKRLGAVATAPAFVELAVREPERVEVGLRSGRTLRVPATIDRAALVALVEALEC